jgi:hypothetical protein
VAAVKCPTSHSAQVVADVAAVAVENVPVLQGVQSPKPRAVL